MIPIDTELWWSTNFFIHFVERLAIVWTIFEYEADWKRLNCFIWYKSMDVLFSEVVSQFQSTHQYDKFIKEV